MLKHSALVELAIQGIAEGTIVGVCVYFYGQKRDSPIALERRWSNITRFDVSLMVQGQSCYYETSVLLHPRHRQSLYLRKNALYNKAWAAVGLTPR